MSKKEIKVYICNSLSCGHAEVTVVSLSYSKRCPKCGGMMIRHVDGVKK